MKEYKEPKSLSIEEHESMYVINNSIKVSKMNITNDGIDNLCKSIYDKMIEEATEKTNSSTI